MGFLDNLFGGKGGVGGIVGAVGQVINDLHTSEDEKAQAKLELQKIINARREVAEATYRAELDARKQVLVAELQHGDAYTKRARPTIIYVGLAVIVLNYVVLPWLTRLGGPGLPPIDLPDAFWYAWSGVAGAYALGRSYEKATGKRNGVSRALTGG